MNRNAVLAALLALAVGFWGGLVMARGGGLGALTGGLGAERARDADAPRAGVGAPSGMAFVRLRVDTSAPQPRACLEFSRDLSADASINYRDFIALDPAANFTATASGKLLCLGGLSYDVERTLTIRRGLPAADGAATAEDEQVALSFGDRPAFVGFAGQGVILPRREADGLGIETVNVQALKVTVLRVSDRILSRDSVREGAAIAEGSWDWWDYENAGQELGKKVYEGRLTIYDPKDAEAKRNQTLTTVFPLGAALKTLEAGAYVVKVEDASPSAGALGQNNSNPAAAHRYVIYTDLALQTFEGAGGMDVIVRSIDTARPVSGVTLTLIAENNDELARVRTDGDGKARFARPLLDGEGALRPRYVMAYGRRDFAALDLNRPTLDLSDQDVEGRLTPGGIDAFMYTERGIYRPGETVRLAAMVRDANGRAITDRESVLVVYRPNGTEARRERIQKARDAGAIVKNVAIDRSAPRGRWRATLEVDGQTAVAGETFFSVEDFVPQRLRVNLEASEAPLGAGQSRPIEVDAQFLYGAPGSGLRIEGEARLGVDPNPFPKWKGFQFGLTEESFDERFQYLDGSVTDGAGQGRIVYAVAEPPQTSLPLRARVVATVFEPGGRTVGEGFDVPVRLSSRYLGLKAGFDGFRLSEGARATFQLAAVDPAGNPQAVRGVRWQLVREDWGYDYYLEGGQWRWRRTGRDIPVRADVANVGASAPVEIAFDTLEPGDYRLTAEDPASGAKSSIRFGMGWGGSGLDDTPDQVLVSGPAEPARPGANVQIDIRPPYAGEAQIVVATDRVLSTRTVRVDPKGTRVSIRAEESWGAGAYVLVTVMTPRSPTERPAPRRAVGVAYVPLDMGGRTLAVSVGEGLGVIRPRQTLEVPVRVANVRGGERVRVTLAAVDEGILQLTKFQSPDPTAHYFGKRALGVAVRDDYGRILNPNLAAPTTPRQGGDGLGGEGLTTVPTKTVALWSGLVTLDRNGAGRIPLAIPDFNGELRLMAVAFTETSLGAASQALTLRDPVVAELTLPRFLSPGDQAFATLTLDNREGAAGTYQAGVATSGVAQATGEIAPIRLDRGARRSLRVPISASAVGLSTVTLTVTGPNGFRVMRTAQIEARAPYLPVTDTTLESQAPGRAFTLTSAAFAPFTPGDGEAVVSYSAVRGLAPAPLLASLERYPYGCTEQLTSVAAPLLYANLVADAEGVARDRNLRARLQDTVNRILDRQGADGAFGLWRADDRASSAWLGAYATDFLRRAKAAGLAVPDKPLNDAYQALRTVARLDDFNASGYSFEVYQWPGVEDSSERLRSRSAAYALYVLAHARRADLGQLRYFHDARLKAEPSPLARAQIGAALAFLGDRSRARSAFRMAEQALGYRNAGDWYQTPLRDLAGVLALAAEAGETELVDRLARRLEREAGPPETLTTQEQAFLLFAANALLERAGEVDVRVNGQPFVGAASYRQALLGQGVTFTNAGKGAVFRSVSLAGPPRAAPPAVSDGFSLEKRLFTLTGQLADPAAIRQGDRVVVALSGAPSAERVHPAALIDLLPAGFEIESVLRPSDGRAPADYYAAQTDGPFAWLGQITPARVAEARDDRFVAAADVSGPFTFAYVARAVSPGTYVLPAGQVEDMYRVGVIARTAPGRITIRPDG